jgi:glutamate/tyrosine decarboxylase-like PLP-dependent enzyme
MTTNNENLLKKTLDYCIEYLNSLKTRPVGVPVNPCEFLAKFNKNLSEDGENSIAVIENLCKIADEGLVATAGPRYFGFVVGGSFPVAIASDWLTTIWDQNAFSFVQSPAASAVEETVRNWLTKLFNLSVEMSLGFVTGGTMANFTGIAAARHFLLKSVNWDVEKQGLFGAPEITVITNEESHISIFASLQMLGLGSQRVIKVAADEQGRMKPENLKEILADVKNPVLVCAQAGNVNTGNFDPISEIAPLVKEKGGWLHVDGAFGFWAAASPKYRHLLNGVEHADSISVDCHKWLNVPYDSGLIFVFNREAHEKAMALGASYYVQSPAGARENHFWVPEASRRARGFTVYAVLRTLGQKGIAALIEHCCQLAQRMADELRAHPRVEILNEVCINQILVRFLPLNEQNIDDYTTEIIKRVQSDGTCWAGGTIWHGMYCMRISVSNWSTNEKDIDLSVKAILSCLDR